MAIDNSTFFFFVILWRTLDSMSIGPNMANTTRYRIGKCPKSLLLVSVKRTT